MHHNSFIELLYNYLVSMRLHTGIIINTHVAYHAIEGRSDQMSEISWGNRLSQLHLPVMCTIHVYMPEI